MSVKDCVFDGSHVNDLEELAADEEVLLAEREPENVNVAESDWEQLVDGELLSEAVGDSDTECVKLSERVSVPLGLRELDCEEDSVTEVETEIA